MINRLILSILLLIITNMANSASGKGYNISGNWVEINRISEEAIQKINSIPDKKNVRLTISKNVDQRQFDEIINNFTWVTHLVVAYGNERIKSFDSVAKLPDLKIFEAKSLQSSKKKPINLKPLSNLTKLEKIDFYATHVKNTKFLTSLVNLKYISFYMSQVKSIKFLSKLPKLEYLDLYGSKHTFRDYKPLAKLQKLKKLNIYMNKQATDRNLKALSGLTGLEKFSTANNDLITNFNFLAKNKNMKEVGAAWCNSLSNASAIKFMNNIENVDLRDTKIKNIKFLSKKPKLQRLNISKTSVTDLSPLGSCDSLESLSIQDTGITNLRPLMACKKLKHLTVSKNVPKSRLKKLTQAINGLKVSKE